MVLNECEGSFDAVGFDSCQERGNGNSYLAFAQHLGLPCGRS